MGLYIMWLTSDRRVKLPLFRHDYDDDDDTLVTAMCLYVRLYSEFIKSYPSERANPMTTAVTRFYCCQEKNYLTY